MWNPDCYNKFQSQRFAPFEDLVALVKIREGLKVVDLGCGAGELTRKLADRMPGSDVLGIDTSSEMLTRAAGQARPGLRFELGSIESASGEWDLVFSNAAIHWVDNHSILIPRLLALVRSEGQLVVQLPSNPKHPTSAFIVETASEEPFRRALNGWVRKSPCLSIGEYAELLYENGGGDITIFEKVYSHVLKDADALAEWTSGAALVPYFERLPKELHESFMKRYREKLWKRWPSSPVFFAFQRILFAATRSL